MLHFRPNVFFFVVVSFINPSTDSKRYIYTQLNKCNAAFLLICRFQLVVVRTFIGTCMCVCVHKNDPFFIVRTHAQYIRSIYILHERENEVICFTHCVVIWNLMQVIYRSTEKKMCLPVFLIISHMMKYRFSVVITVLEWHGIYIYVTYTACITGK